MDGTGKAKIDTGIGFLDHMVEQISRHGLIDVTLKAKGDLHIDDHHTTEDSGYVLGDAISKALGERKGINRYGFSCLCFITASCISSWLDFSKLWAIDSCS